MTRKLTNAGLVLSTHGLLVIRPKTLLADVDVRRLLSQLATLVRGQRTHLITPHCTVVKDHDEGSDLFMIEACTQCPASTAA